VKKRVLQAASMSDSFKELLHNKGYELVLFQPDAIDFNVDGIVTSTKLILDAKMLSRFGHLKWVARLGSGIEIIDMDYCQENNIVVASSPAGISNAVAEHCIAMLIVLKKKIVSSFREVQEKKWIREPNRGWELEGQTVGIIGYGHTGMAFAKKLSVFGVKVIAYDKYKYHFADSYVEEIDLPGLQQQADIISFHVPLNEETKHYYDQNFIASCKQHILINTSRGAIVKTEDLLSALENKTVLGAALDVLENEKELNDSKSTVWETVENLLEYNLIVTPHIAGYSHNAIQKMSDELMEKLKDKI
jgi:D-3-phosphoglycerate dehydrogenase